MEDKRMRRLLPVEISPSLHLAELLDIGRSLFPLYED
jgi:hypothetical protein